MGHPESPVFANLMLTRSECRSFRYLDPSSSSSDNLWHEIQPQSNRILAQRYHMIERVRAAAFVGIVVGTLGAACYAAIITRLQAIVNRAKRKVKVFVVGKLNVPKLANFSEVDVFVLVACPLSTVVDSKEYFAPIVTPFELELALAGTREWDGRYATDFRTLLPSLSALADPIADLPQASQDTSIGATELRTVVGGTMILGENKSQGTTGQLAVQHKPAGLLARSFQGLMIALGETAPSKATTGQSGIARGYSEEESRAFECQPIAEDQHTQVATEKMAAVPLHQSTGGLRGHEDEEHAVQDKCNYRAPRNGVLESLQDTEPESPTVSDSSLEMDMEEMAHIEDALDNL